MITRWGQPREGLISWIYNEPSSSEINPTNTVSSANLTIEHDSLDERQLGVYRMNNKGANTVPCGTSVFEYRVSDYKD